MGSMIWEKAPDVKKSVSRLRIKLDLKHLSIKNIHCFRSYGSSSRAIARIWGLPRIWQMALSTEPSYCIEVISERYDKLNERQKAKVLIHELTHVPNNFSGALTPHIRRGNRSFRKKVDTLTKSFFRNN